jgi:hypothetical protein
MAKETTADTSPNPGISPARVVVIRCTPRPANSKMPVGTRIPRVTIPKQCATWGCEPREKYVATIVAVTWVTSFKAMKATPESGSESIPSVCNTLKVHQPPSSQRDHLKHLRKQIKTWWE